MYYKVGGFPGSHSFGAKLASSVMNKQSRSICEPKMVTT